MRDTGITIDLSADLGEGAPGEEEVWPLIDSANVACGGHVGDGDTMRDAVERSLLSGVRLGAHPSYPDRQNFGRKSLSIEPSRLRESLRDQLKELHNIALAAGATLRHVKPHGALYNDAHRDAALASVVVDSIRALDPDLAIVCGATSQMATAARAAGLGVIREAFADRRYEADGSLVSRSLQGSLLTIGEAAEQAGLLASDGAVIARDGTRLPIAFDTICIHADLEGAAARLHAIRKRLQR